jgi:hypothetical protein
MLATELAVLHEFQSVRVIFLVFLRVVVSLLAFGAGESDLYACVISHSGTSYLDLFDVQRTPVYLPPKRHAPSLSGGAWSSDFRAHRFSKNAHKEKTLLQR